MNGLFEVIDDFVSPETQQVIQDEIMNTKWTFRRNVSEIPFEPVVEGYEMAKYQNGFHSNIFSKGAPDSENNLRLTGVLLPLIHKAQQIVNNKNTELVRIKGGLFVNGEAGLHRPHIDYYQPHYTFLYYVNDSDGDTYLFDQVSEPVDMNVYPRVDPVYPEKFTVADSVPPKAGRLVIMDGLLYHSSSAPVEHSDRLAITMNVIPKQYAW